jgi:hypothetical protein
MPLDKILKTQRENKPFTYPKSAKSVCGGEYIKGSVGGGKPKKAQGGSESTSTVSITSITIM